MTDLRGLLSGSERFWGFREPPFSLTSDPRFLFTSAAHTDALGQFEQWLERDESVLLITGEPGVGKTLWCRTVARRRDDRTFIALVSTAPASREDLLRAILDSFGLLAPAAPGASSATRLELLKALRQFLQTLEQLDARAIIVVDDAHRMPVEGFEELQMARTVLIGEPSLQERLASSALQDPTHRVIRRTAIGTLTPAEVHAYVEHRVRMARQADAPAESPFTPAALDAIAAASGGVPRVINLICDRALERACDRARDAVDEREIAAVARELGIARPARFRARRHLVGAAAAAAVFIAAISGAAWRQWHHGVVRLPVQVPGIALPARGQTADPPAAAGAAPEATASELASEQQIRAQADALARVPDVRALLRLRDQIAGRPAPAADQDSRAELLEAIDADIEAARRLQLDVDRQWLQQLSGTGTESRSPTAP